MMHGNRWTGKFVAAAAAVAVLGGPAEARASAWVRGLPAAAASAARSAEPVLPRPRGWSFPEAFSRTSGTGRMIGGALEWSDWVYDDYGPATPQGAPLNTISANGPFSPAHGEYVYPPGAAENDGADIFRAAVGLTRTASVWRVDWSTLVDPKVPIAEWTFDTDDNARTGASAWPAGANVVSPGIERALVVSSRGAQLIDPMSGRVLDRLATTVDLAARSFVVHVPRSVMPVRGAWRIRLGAGLADATGTGFAIPTVTGGAPAPASAARLYNVTFRTVAQEPPIFTSGSSEAIAGPLHNLLAGTPGAAGLGADGATVLSTGNFWAEDDQADALASGDISRFSELVRWSQLARKRTTAPPLVHGYSDRWYVSDLKLGQGVNAAVDANPAYLGRIQPYAVYVPRAYNGRHPIPLTWLLHSLDVNYNQYGAINPRQLAEECEARNSICASPEGFGADGGWAADAEHDFWQVWRQMALGFRLDPARTVISGYSMGGIGSFQIGLTYPAAFSEAMPLDGLDDSACGSLDRAANARWEPFVISNALLDEESPWTDGQQEASQFEAAGNRYAFFTTTMPEHNATAASDGFATQIAALGGTPPATIAPGTISYAWCAAVVDRKLGLGPGAVYWLSGLAQRNAASSSAITANDKAIPTPAFREQSAMRTVVPPDAPPMVEVTGTPKPGASPAGARDLTLTLANVAALTLDTVAARLPSAVAQLTSDGPATLRLTGLKPGTLLTTASERTIATASGRASIGVAAGTTTVSW